LRLQDILTDKQTVIQTDRQTDRQVDSFICYRKYVTQQIYILPEKSSKCKTTFPFESKVGSYKMIQEMFDLAGE